MNPIIEIMRENEGTQIGTISCDGIMPDIGDEISLYSRPSGTHQTVKIERKTYLYDDNGELHKIQFWCI
jgi:hypothetical protein